MENILTIIEFVLFTFYVIFLIRYTKKDTLLPLIGYAFSSAGICALSIVTIIFKSNLNIGYEMELIIGITYALNFFVAILLILKKLVKNSKKYTDAPDK